jgi:hypothetical protein
MPRHESLPYLAAAITLLPAIVAARGDLDPARWEAAVDDAWHAYGVGYGPFFEPENANALWVNADAAAQLAGRPRVGAQGGACPVASTVKLASGGELWVRADAAYAQLTLVSRAGEDLHAVRIPASQLVGGVHTIEHEGLRAQLVVARGGARRWAYRRATSSGAGRGPAQRQSARQCPRHDHG